MKNSGDSASVATTMVNGKAPPHGEWTNVKATVIVNDELEKIVCFPSFSERGCSTTAIFCPVTPYQKGLCTWWSLNVEVPVRVRWIARWPDLPSRWEACPLPKPDGAKINAKCSTPSPSPKVVVKKEDGAERDPMLGFFEDLRVVGQMLNTFASKHQKSLESE